MNDATQKIAAEAAREWYSRVSPAYTTRVDELAAHIQSAIKKATEELANKLQWAKTDSYTEGYNKALGEWLRGEQPSRAAHASDGYASESEQAAIELERAITAERYAIRLENELKKATTRSQYKRIMERICKPAHASEPWKKCKLIDRAAGWAVLCGKDIIIEGLVLEQTNKLIAAHNATLQSAHASEQS